MILGGGMANTFLAARDTPIGKSLCEHDMLDTAKEKSWPRPRPPSARSCFRSTARSPKNSKKGVDPVTAPVEMIPEDGMMLDIGPISAEMFEDRLAECRTVALERPAWRVRA